VASGGDVQINIEHRVTANRGGLNIPINYREGRNINIEYEVMVNIDNLNINTKCKAVASREDLNINIK